MLSDFIDNRNCFLALTETEYESTKMSNPNIKRYARDFLEYGEHKEGYWNLDKFMAQIHRAVEIAEI